MTVLKVDKSRGRWEALPVSLIQDDRLPYDTRGFAIWITCLPDGWEIRVDALRRRAKIGKQRWERMARELDACGYLKRSRTQTDEGQFEWSIVFNPAPLTMVCDAADGESTGGIATSGDAADINKTDLKQTELNQMQQHAALPAAAPRKKRRVLHRVTCWDDDDRAAVASIVAAYGESVVVGAAAALRARGSEPLPGRVEKEIEHQLRTANQKTAQDAARRTSDDRQKQKLQSAPEVSAAGQKIIEKIRLKRLSKSERGGTMTD